MNSPAAVYTVERDARCEKSPNVPQCLTIGVTAGDRN
jgi:hypothetical protein